MGLTKDEIEAMRDQQNELGLSDAEIQMVEENSALFNPFGNPKSEQCPVCGEKSCIKRLAYVEETKVHYEDHPEHKNLRGIEKKYDLDRR